MPETLLIIDNDASQLRIKEEMLQHKLHYRTLVSTGNEEALGRIFAEKKLPVSLVLLDLDTLAGTGLIVINVYPRGAAGTSCHRFCRLWRS